LAVVAIAGSGAAEWWRNVAKVVVGAVGMEIDDNSFGSEYCTVIECKYSTTTRTTKSEGPN
jgi:hypothetical protein